jgi:hypothetical protein
MNRKTKLKLAWKYRKQLWKHRWAIRHRREIFACAMAGAGAAVAAGIFFKRPRSVFASVTGS